MEVKACAMILPQQISNFCVYNTMSDESGPPDKGANYFSHYGR